MSNLNTKKSQNSIGWLLDKFNNFKTKQLKYHDSLFDAFKWELNDKFGRGLIDRIINLYHPVLCYERWLRIGDQSVGRTDIIWSLRKPFTLTFYQDAEDGYCPTCHARDVEHGGAYEDDYQNYIHADHVDVYTTNIFLKNKKYSHTQCSCEKLIFEPLEKYYLSGGYFDYEEDVEEGKIEVLSQWDINKEIDTNDIRQNLLKLHKKQLLPKNWSCS